MRTHPSRFTTTSEPIFVDGTPLSRKIFELDDGNLTAHDENGEPVFSKRNACGLLTVHEWSEELKVAAPHLFQKREG